jgi:integrase
MAELLGLTWADVDRTSGTISVRHALVRHRGRYVLDEPKTRRSMRTIVLPSFAREALEEHRRRQLEERLAAGAPTEDGLVFVSPAGRPINGGWLSHRWRKLAAAAGLDLRFHDLRHGQASLLVALGVHPRVVAERLGHATTRMAMDRYAHVDLALDREAAERLDAALG